MQITGSWKGLMVLAVYVALVGCSEESSQGEPTNTNDTLVGDGADAEGDSEALCGNGTVDPGEACDDGEANSDELSDACRTNCTEATCGDGVIDLRLNETCDDGNSIDDDGCNNLCRLPSCGDGVLQTGEACDDGSDNSDTRPDACRANCTEARCGDSTTDSNEECDDGNNSSIDDCVDCMAAICGDGIIHLNVETCDDANVLSGDGCSNFCQEEPGFECQNGPSVCSTICGDGIVAGTEQCDDSNNISGDYCSAVCQITGRCGDGMTQTNEQCDDGNATVGDYCSNGCIATGSCGDGVVQILAGEACDDGNNANGDGCLGSCALIEPGWDCFGTPTNCDPILCGANQHVQNNACVVCPAGTDNTAGDDTSGADTACDTIFCAINQYVQDNVCISCPPGTGNVAGDDATGANTTCENIFCAVNQRVQNNACISCAPGTTNAGGDDATGSNTACDAVLCAVDEHVQNNACVACPFAMINAAGDDASGPDTACDNEPCYLALGVFCADFEQAYIKASNTTASDYFGNSVALDGDTLAVGAYWEDSFATGINGNQADNSAPNSGAVYVFTRSGTTWTQQAYIKASNTDAGDQFGISVALSGDTLAVGASYEDSVATGINGNQTDNSTGDSGAVYVFTRSGTTWIQEAYIKASNTGADDKFGDSVALDGDTLAVGAFSDDSAATGINGDQVDNAAFDSGAVYIFTRSGTTWNQQAYIKASNTAASDNFGDSVALDGDTLAVGAYYEDSAATGINGDQVDNSTANSGAVYVFVRSGTTWTQQAYIKASNTGLQDQFGISVALDGDALAVGAYWEDSVATGINGNQTDNSTGDSGAVYVFARSGTTWTQQAYIKASYPGTSDRFGNSVAFSGDTLAVGAYYEDSGATGVNGDQVDNSASNSGAVYVFTRSGTTWTQTAYIKASNTGAGDSFGGMVALSGDTLAVGASYEGSGVTGVNGDQTNNFLSDSGAVYVRKIAP